MNVIIWARKPANFDTHRVIHLWFQGSTLFYSIDGDRTPLKAKLTEVREIVTENLYVSGGWATR